MTGRSTKIDTIQELNIKGNAINNSQDTADYFNNFFSLVTGDSKNPSNYRPISFSTSFSKICEKIIDSRLNQHIYDDNILADEQLVSDISH